MRRLFILASCCAGTALLWPSGAPAAPPAGPDLSAVHPQEQWLSRIVLDEAARCDGPKAWDRLGRKLESAALGRLACGRLDLLGALTDLVYAARLCAYLPMAERGQGGKELARWLLRHYEASRRLFRALEEAPSREEALKRFAELWAAEEARVLAYPDLAVAFATTEPLEHYRRQPDALSLVESFRYYTDPNRTFRHDLKALPYETLRYLADTRISLAEREWACQTYRGKDPYRSYFHVKYDTPFFTTGRAKLIDSMPYTLENLSTIGGVCLDQAYYGAEVCKAMGIPASIVHGRGGEGVEHAWFAYCRTRGNGAQVAWVSRTGRYREQNYFVGTVRDPIDGKMIYDSELMLLSTSVHLPLRQREEADAATTLARLVDGCLDRQGAGDLAVLGELGRAFSQRFGGKAGEPALDERWVAARRKIDLSLLEDLLDTAIRRNLGHRPAWRLLVDLRKAGRVPVEDLNRFFTVLIERTGARYPDFSCLTVMRIVPTIPDAAHRRKVCERAITVYAQRPDLTGRLLIALGDDLREDGKSAEALAAYRRAAVQGVKAAEVVVQAARRAEELLLAGNRRDEAIGLYRDLFAKTEKQDVSGYFRAQTSHFQLGNRLADLLATAGRPREAEKVRAQL